MFQNVGGPSPVKSVDGFYYYIIFVDHFTKYVWLYPLHLKSNVFTIFCQYKVVVEKFFKCSIISVYSNCGGEYTALKDFSCFVGTQHLKAPPHTPQHNVIAERRHKHIVDTGLTLLHQAKIPHKYWSCVFQTVAYLIN